MVALRRCAHGDPLTYDDWKTTEPDDHPCDERDDRDDGPDNREDDDDDDGHDDDDEMDRAERYGWGV